MKGLSGCGSSGPRGGHLHSARLGPRLVAELHQRHQHGQAQATDQDVEDSGHIAEAQRARLVLQGRGEEEEWGSTASEWGATAAGTDLPKICGIKKFNARHTNTETHRQISVSPTGSVINATLATIIRKK